MLHRSLSEVQLALCRVLYFHPYRDVGKCWRGDGRAGEGEGIEYQAEKEVTPRKCGVEEPENTRLHYNADSNNTRQKKKKNKE